MIIAVKLLRNTKEEMIHQSAVDGAKKFRKLSVGYNCP
jgi:ABC-type sugar transport system permease subunit